jgi:hypothetical protein
MARHLERQPWLAKTLVALVSSLFVCVTGAHVPPPLTQAQLDNDPEAVAAWLRAHAARADRKTAARFAALGDQYKARGDWSGAGKGYGTSAQYFPDPAVIADFARVRTLDLAKVRANANRADLQEPDLLAILGLYRSALAAHSVVTSLPPDRLAAVQAAVRCLSSPEIRKRSAADCEPVQSYHAEYERVSRTRR